MSIIGTTLVKVLGSWKVVDAVWHKVSGSWVEYDTIFAKVAGIWKYVFNKDPVPIGVVLMKDEAVEDTSLGWYNADGTNGTPLLNDGKFCKITTSPLDTGGSSSHTHVAATFNTSTVSNQVSNDQKNPVHAHMTKSTHYHTAHHTHTGSNYPSRCQFVPFYGGWFLPTNSILMWPDSAEPNWTFNYTAFNSTADDRLIKFGTFFISEDYPLHYDSYSGYSGYVNTPLATISRDYGTNPATYGQHRHRIDHTHATISRDASYPPFKGMKLYKINESLRSVPQGACFFYTLSGTVPHGYTELTSSYLDKFINISQDSSYVGGALTHSVPSGNFKTDTIHNYTRIHGLQENDYYGKQNHTHTINHGHAASAMVGDNQPPYRTYRLIRKD